MVTRVIEEIQDPVTAAISYEVNMYAFIFKYVTEMQFWIYTLLFKIIVNILTDVWVLGLFIFEYGKEDTVLQSDTRLLPDKADEDSDLFTGE